MLKLKSLKKITFFLSFILFFSHPLQTFGAISKKIDVEFDFSGEASSYLLYQDGIFLCETFDLLNNKITCQALIDDQPISFTMTAITPAGETPPSAAYIVTPPKQDGFGNFIPTALFTTDVTSGDVPLDVNFDASSSSDFDGNIVSYEWDFGDGDVANGETIDHTFFLPGTYTTTLTVVDNANASSSATITIEVTGSPAENIVPTAVINAKSTGDNTTYKFYSYGSTDADGTILEYYWDFGDGDVDFGEIIEHTFLLSGTYTTTLTVTDDASASTSATITIEVPDLPADNIIPTAVINAASPSGNNMYQFDAYDSTDADGLIVKYYWDFGDDVVGNGEIIEHTFLLPGVYTTTLTVFDDSNASNSATIPIEITIPVTEPPAKNTPPTAVINAESPENNTTYQFNAQNSTDKDGLIVFYHWDFGDGKAATSDSVEHIYAERGTYTVTLTVIDDKDQTGKTQQTITISNLSAPQLSAIQSGDTAQTECEAADNYWCNDQCQESVCDEGESGFAGVADSGTREVGSPVTFTMNPQNSYSSIVSYRYSVHPDYGTDGFNNLQWQSMTDSEWVADNSIDYTFTEPGKYIVVMWASEDTDNADPNGIPIIGYSVDMSDDSSKTNIIGFDVSGTKETGKSVTFTVNAENKSSETLYYRFSMHPDYGTSGYDGQQWESMTSSEWVSTNSLDYTFKEAGKYIVVVWVTDDITNVNPADMPIIGGSVEIK